MKPCNECPFRKLSAPGYLGELNFRPELFLMQLDEGVMPCHLSIDWEKKDIDRWTPCIGAMQFMNNHGKISRIEIYAFIQRQCGKNENVFQFRHEFIQHHSRNGI